MDCAHLQARALLARVESGTGEDRELDAASHVAMCEPETHPDYHRRFRLPHRSLDHMDMCAAGTYWLVERSGRSMQTSPRYTSSLDAVITLVERVLPGWDIMLARISGEWSVAIGPADSFQSGLEHVSLCPARALLAALIKAKMEESYADNRDGNG